MNMYTLLHIGFPHQYTWHPMSFIIRSFPGGSMLKNLPAMQEMKVQTLGWEDLLEEGMATHSTIHAWRIPWTEEAGGLQSTES